jgi:hypothetical protein
MRRRILTTVATHLALVRAGWVALWLGVLTQLCVATFAAYVLWQGRCFDVEYTFTPLLLSCAPRSAAALALGWIGTAVVCVAPVFALVAGLVSTTVARTASRPDPLLRSVWLSATAAVTGAILWIVFATASGPQPWGEGGWIFIAAVAALGWLVLSAFLQAIVLALRRDAVDDASALQNVSPGPPRS